MKLYKLLPTTIIHISVVTAYSQRHVISTNAAWYLEYWAYAFEHQKCDINNVFCMQNIKHLLLPLMCIFRTALCFWKYHHKQFPLFLYGQCMKYLLHCHSIRPFILPAKSFLIAKAPVACCNISSLLHVLSCAQVWDISDRCNCFFLSCHSLLDFDIAILSKKHVLCVHINFLGADQTSECALSHHWCHQFCEWDSTGDRASLHSSVGHHVDYDEARKERPTAFQEDALPTLWWRGTSSRLCR